MAFTLKISTTQALVNRDGSIGQIVQTRFMAEKAADDIKASINTNINIPQSYAPAQIPFDTVTEADVEAWVRDLYPEATLEAELDLKLEAAATPLLTDQLPWQRAYPLWAYPVAYAVGAIVIFNTQTRAGRVDINYECIRAHTSQRDLSPPVSPALWEVFVDENL